MDGRSEVWTCSLTRFVWHLILFHSWIACIGLPLPLIVSFFEDCYKSIRTADDRANYDAACKRLLSEKIILAWIVKSCMEEFRDCDVKDIASRYIEGEPQVSEVPVMPDETNAATVIHGINTEDASQTEGTVTYDIRFLASLPSSSGKIRMILNVEGQNNFYPGYPIIKRGIYYCSRMISAQYGTEFVAANYSDIKSGVNLGLYETTQGPGEHHHQLFHHREEPDRYSGGAG